MCAARSGERRDRGPYKAGTYRRGLAELLAAVGWWPPHIEFDMGDLVTVIEVLNKQRRHG